jgi:glycosyltransferase involved in cell wall biosynthesis
VLSVIVPAYRAAETIYETLGVLLDCLEGLGEPFEVIVVPDGVDDATAEEAARHFHRVRISGYDEHRGKGFAIRHGIGEALGDHIAYIDADNELHPDGLGRLLKMVTDGAHVALGSKRHAESQISYPWSRRLQSATYQWLVRRLFGLKVTDTQTGLKVFDGGLLREVTHDGMSDGFAFDLELLVALRDRGAVFVEGPVTLDYRYKSTITPGATVRTLFDTFRIYYRRKRRRAPTGAR